MGVKFLHTADLQIGMKASHVAQAAGAVREARIQTLERLAALAKERGADFLLIAGDLFEDNAVGNDVVHRALRALERAAPVPVYILPGNHDLLVPGGVYERAAFRSGPPGVHVLRSCEPVPVAGGKAVLIPAPVRQKHSDRDPTSGFPEQSRAAQGVIKIGVAHGSPRIEGKHQPDDHPIALDAAERAGLDYLALGHWHSWLKLGERTVMPGAPEPTSFGEESGYAALVSIEAPGALPAIEKVPVGALKWVERAFDAEAGASALEREVKEWFSAFGDPERTLVRVRLFGLLAPEAEEALAELGDWLAARALYSEIDTKATSLALSAGRLREIAAAHPFVAGLLSDLAALAAMASPGGAEGLFSREAASASDLSPAATASDWQALREILRKNELELDPAVVGEAVRQLARAVGEVWR